MFRWIGADSSCTPTEKFKDDSSVFDDIEEELEVEEHARAVVKDNAHTARHRKGHALHPDCMGTAIDNELNDLLEPRTEDPCDMASIAPSTTSYYSSYADNDDSFSASRSVYKSRRRQRRKHGTSSNSHLSEYQLYLRESNPAGVVRKWFLQLVHMPPRRRAMLGVGILTCTCMVWLNLWPKWHGNPIGPRRLQTTQSMHAQQTYRPDRVSTEAARLRREDPEGVSVQARLLAEKQQEVLRDRSDALTTSVITSAMSQYAHGRHEDFLPHQLRDSFADVWDLPIQHTDRPYYFQIPKSGSTSLQDILTHCLHLVSASMIGVTEGHASDPMLEVNTYKDKGKYVNVNTASTEGLQRARDLGLVSSGLADVIITHRFHEGAALFDSTHRARGFAVLRHPVRRAISMLYYLQRATWEPTYDASLANLTLEEYAQSSRAEENWVTRSLTHEYEEPLTEQHVDLAKEILRRKFIVGLLEKFDESIKRIQLYFGWWEEIVRKDPEKCIRCQQSKTQASHNQVPHPEPPESDPGFQGLARLNWADMEVYEYAVQLFEEQASLVSTKTASLV